LVAGKYTEIQWYRSTNGNDQPKSRKPRNRVLANFRMFFQRFCVKANSWKNYVTIWNSTKIVEREIVMAWFHKNKK
jgi:hypothetical protein